MDHGNVVYGPDNNSTILTIVTLASSTFGIFLSIVALFLLFLTAFLFQEWRDIYKNQLLMQFMTARFIFTLDRYIYDILNVFDRQSYTNPVLVYIFSMIYSEMALVTWMFVFSKHMYNSFVKVVQVEQRRLWKVSLVAWLLPALISFLLYLLYTLPSRRDLLFLLVYLVFIKWPVLCLNGIHLAFTLKYILSSNQSKTEHNFRIVMVMILLIFTFSIQQALSDIHKFVYIIIYNRYENVPYVFTITNILTIYQGAFTTVFWLFGNSNTRKLWKFKNEAAV